VAIVPLPKNGPCGEISVWVLPWGRTNDLKCRGASKKKAGGKDRQERGCEGREQGRASSLNIFQTCSWGAHYVLEEASDVVCRSGNIRCDNLFHR